MLLGWVLLGLSLVDSDGPKEAKDFNTEVVDNGGLSLGVNLFKADVEKEKQLWSG